MHFFQIPSLLQNIHQCKVGTDHSTVGCGRPVTRVLNLASLNSRHSYGSGFLMNFGISFLTVRDKNSFKNNKIVRIFTNIIL